VFPDAFFSFFLFFTLIPRIVSCLPYSIWGGIRISEVSLKRVCITRDTTRTRRERRKKETDTEGDHTTNNFFDNSRQYQFWDFIRRRQAPRLNPYPSKEGSPELSGCEACFSHHQSLICSTMSPPEAIPTDPAEGNPLHQEICWVGSTTRTAVNWSGKGSSWRNRPRERDNSSGNGHYQVGRNGTS
jgi:hypothetical protein